MVTIGKKTKPKGPAAVPQGKPPRQMTYTSQRCFRVARLGWEWTLASLPADIILVLLIGENPTALPPDATFMLGVLIAVAATGTLRDQIFKLIAKFRSVQMKIQKHHIKYLLIALGMLGAAEVIARGVSRPIGAPLAYLAVGAIIVIGSVAQSFRRIKKIGEKFLTDRVAQVEQANTLHLTVVAVPIAAARLMSLLIALQTLDLGTGTLGSLAALILLLALHPVESDFMAPCRQCQQMTSRVLKTEGFCPYCCPEKFQ